MVQMDINKSIEKLGNWVEEHNYEAYEPFDGLSSFIRPLTFGNLFLDRLLMQLIRQSPLNLRPILGVKPLPSTKGQGYMAWGYLLMYKRTKKEVYKEKAVSCLEWLIKNKSPKFDEFSWANHFDFASRGGRYEKHDSIIVWTSLIGQTFLDAFELFGESKYLEIAKSICRWILSLPILKTESGSCLGYLSTETSDIHNSSMLGAAMLARTGRITGNNELIRVAKEAMDYSCTRQLPDGSWWYGERPNCHWIDNFHTGYNLDSLKLYIETTGDERYISHLEKGFNYYKDTFFESSGRPKYYNSRTYPVDSQCASQSIDTLSCFSDMDPSALPLALKVANWTIVNMQDEEGFFYYRQYPLGIKAKAPMLHWAQATTYKALALLLLKL